MIFSILNVLTLQRFNALTLTRRWVFALFGFVTVLQASANDWPQFLGPDHNNVALSLQELGLHNATDLIGGFQAWEAAGLPVDKG